jgi:hypothetical protein
MNKLKNMQIQYLYYNSYLLHKCLCRQTWIHRREIWGGGEGVEVERESERARERERVSNLG